MCKERGAGDAPRSVSIYASLIYASATGLKKSTSSWFTCSASSW
jgi:hypothetical protein